MGYANAMNDDFDARIAIEEWNGALGADPLDPPTVRAEAGVVIDQLADALDDSDRAVLILVRNLGDRAFKRNDTLNVNRAEEMERLRKWNEGALCHAKPDLTRKEGIDFFSDV